MTLRSLRERVFFSRSHCTYIKLLPKISISTFEMISNYLQVKKRTERDNKKKKELFKKKKLKGIIYNWKKEKER